jgi:hypothetical protein
MRLNKRRVMKRDILVALVVLICGSAAAQEAVPAGANSSAEIQELRQQVQALTEMVKTLQQQVQQSPKPDATSSAPLPENPEPPQLSGTSSTPVPSASAPPLFPTSDTSVTFGSASAASAPAVSANGTAFPTSDSSVTAADSSAAAASDAGSALAQPMPVAGGGGGKNYMNISFDGLFTFDESSTRHVDRLQVGDHDPQQRGFNARNLELALDGAVDPYFEAFANIVFKLDNDNETEIEVEEAFLQTTSLPFGLQVKAGQFFAPFGRLNTMHPHAWDFSDAALVHGRLLGPDGLRGVGAQVSWTVPVPWYSQVFLAMQNGRGGTGYSFRNPGEDGIFYGRLTTDRELRGLQDFVFVPRWENSVNLGDTQTVLGGVSGAFGSNETGAHSHTQIYGSDFLYKWKSARAEGGFPFVKWQTEAMYRRFEAGRGVDLEFPVAETFHDWGLYSQVLWGFKKGWIAGVRGEHLHMQESEFTDDDERQSRERVSVNLTYLPTEFSRLRLQYNHDFLEENEFLAGRDVDSVILQFEFILGAHGAHKF